MRLQREYEQAFIVWDSQIPLLFKGSYINVANIDGINTFFNSEILLVRSSSISETLAHMANFPGRPNSLISGAGKCFIQSLNDASRNEKQQ